MDKKFIILIAVLILNFLSALHAQTVKNNPGTSAKEIADMMNDSLPLPWNKLVSTMKTKSGYFNKALFMQPPADNVNGLRNEATRTLHTLTDNPFSFRAAVINYTGISDSGYLSVDRKQYYAGNFDIITSWAISGIPVSVSFRNQSWINAAVAEANIFSVKYDRANYLDALRNKLSNHVDPSKFLSGIGDPLELVKKKLEEELQNEINETVQRYKGLDSKLKSIGNIENLYTTEIQTLRKKLLNNKSGKEIEEMQRQFTELQQKKNMGQAVDSFTYRRLDSSLNEIGAVKNLLDKIESHKQNWQSSGLLERMKQWDILKKVTATRQANSDGNIMKLARRYLNLNGLQKLLLKVNKLNLGQNAQSVSPLTMQHFLNNGVMSEFLNNNKYLMLLDGKQQNNNILTDLPFSNNAMMAGGMAKAIRLGKGDNASSHTRFRYVI